MALGGGLIFQFPPGGHPARRIPLCAVPLFHPLTSTNNQNNFRYCGGIVFKFQFEVGFPARAFSHKGRLLALNGWRGEGGPSILLENWQFRLTLSR